MMSRTAKIYIAGHKGLLGSALMEQLIDSGYTSLITRAHSELDLRDQKATLDFFQSAKPDYVFNAAARVGGIQANMIYPAQFIYDNTMIAANIIHAAYMTHVKKLLFIGSSCIYPKNCPQPITENMLLASYLEKTNEPYAVAKIAGIIMCQSYNREYGTNFISCMPTNLYGPHDTFDPIVSHVIPALIVRMVEARDMNKKAVALWGTGKQRREFLYSADCAQALIFLMNNYTADDVINVGTGIDYSIADIAQAIAQIVGFKGEILWDTTQPEGTFAKRLDVDRLHGMGWHHTVSLIQGIEKTVQWYLKAYKKYEHSSSLLQALS